MSSERTSPVGLETQTDRPTLSGLGQIPAPLISLSTTSDSNGGAPEAGGRQEPEGEGVTQPQGRVVTGVEANVAARTLATSSDENTPVAEHVTLAGGLESLQTTRWSSEPRLNDLLDASTSAQPFDSFKSPISEPTKATGGLASLYKPLSERQQHPLTPDVRLLEEDLSALSLVSKSSRTYSRLSESSSASTIARDRTARMMEQAILPNGAVDYEKLRALLSEQRREYKEKLSREKAKRVALEELLVRYGRKKQSERKKSGRRDKGMSGRRRSSDTSIESGDLLDLVRRQLKKDKRTHERSGYSSSLESSAQRTPAVTQETKQHDPANKENFYESTSLFSWPRQTVVPEAATSAPVEERRDKPKTQPSSLWKAFPASDSSTTAAKQPDKQRATGWWWLNEKGTPSEKMPPCPQDLLHHRRSSFIERSQSRQRKIAAASYLRQENARFARMLAEQVAKGERSLEEANDLLNERRSAQPNAFPRRQIIQETRQKVRQLPEFQLRELERRRQLEYNTNRICAQMYKQKLIYNVIQKGRVNMD